MAAAQTDPIDKGAPPSVPLVERDQQIELGVRLELFDIDLTRYGGDILHLHPSGRLDGDTAPWQGNTYVPFPLELTGSQATTEGQLPRPTLSVGNIDGIVTSLCQRYKDLLRVPVTRHLTLREFCDDQPGADPTQEIAETWFIEQRTGETETAVQFTLVSAIDAEGLLLPSQQISAHYCVSTFRGAECSWANTDLLFDRDDAALPWLADRGQWNPATGYAVGDKVYLLNNGVRSYYVARTAGFNAYPPFSADAWRKDQCSKRRAGCECRFGVGNPLPALLFPASWRIG